MAFFRNSPCPESQIPPNTRSSLPPIPYPLPPGPLPFPASLWETLWTRTR